MPYCFASGHRYIEFAKLPVHDFFPRDSLKVPLLIPWSYTFTLTLYNFLLYPAPINSGTLKYLCGLVTLDRVFPLSHMLDILMPLKFNDGDEVCIQKWTCN